MHTVQKREENWSAEERILTLSAQETEVTVSDSTDRSQSRTTWLLLALHRYTQEPRPTLSTFWADQSTRFK